MAELHLTGIDDRLMARLQERAQESGHTIEQQARDILREAITEGGTDRKEEQTLRMPAADRSFEPFEPVATTGISASELLIRDRRHD